MFFGVSTLQTFHVLISLIGIATGFVVSVRDVEVPNDEPR